MIDQRLKERASRLIRVAFAERPERFSMAFADIIKLAAGRGLLGGRTTRQAIQDLAVHEMEARSVIVWGNLVRAHRAIGSVYEETLAEDLKKEFSSWMRCAESEVRSALSNRVQGLRNLGVVNPLDHVKIVEHLQSKYEVEIDLYVDSLSAGPGGGATSQQYNFYGAVGAVQTGAGASANVIQSLDAAGRADIVAALNLVGDVVLAERAFDNVQQQELLDIVRQCKMQVDSPKPNNTSLRSAFLTLATAIQTLASSGPAYQALKSALLPLGIMLP